MKYGFEGFPILLQVLSKLRKFSLGLVIMQAICNNAGIMINTFFLGLHLKFTLLKINDPWEKDMCKEEILDFLCIEKIFLSLSAFLRECQKHAAACVVIVVVVEYDKNSLFFVLLKTEHMCIHFVISLTSSINKPSNW